jgi:hypothetical protein
MAQGGEHEGTQHILSNNQQHGEDHEGLDVSLPTAETPVRAHNTRQHRQDRSDTDCQGELVHARVDLNVMLGLVLSSLLLLLGELVKLGQVLEEACDCLVSLLGMIAHVKAATCTCSLRLARVHVTS